MSGFCFRLPGSAGAAAVFAVVTWLGTTSPAWADLVKGPHLQDLRTDGVTIVWEQQSSGAGTVSISGSDYTSSASGLLQEVRITGLSPATTYDYTLQTDGVTASGSFATAPSEPLSSIRFVVMGDNRTDPVAHESVVSAVLAEGPVDFVLNTGDMVASGEVAADWQQFFDVEQPLIQNTAWYPLIGNHEEDGGDLPHFYTDYLAPPTDTSGLEGYYSFAYANSAFVVLDGHVNTVDVLFGLWRNFDDTQRAWLDTVLGQYQADPAVQHIFVLNHEPPYSSSPGRSGMHALRLLLPMFESYGVDALFSGHDHYLERGESPKAIPYFIMGGGGAPLYDNSSEGNLGFKAAMAIPWLDDAHTVHFARKAYGYLLVDVCNGQVDTTVKDTSGNVLDTFGWNTGDVAPGGCDG
ncbi:MAG: metallophosphoesterase, partial [Deltaproteobacteria bacterium]|nr:metallophosphoesterase [Deltaproteobacteria bacterium]